MESLKKYYAMSIDLKGESSNTAKKMFFNEFPDSFSELKEIYGYDEEKDTLILGYLYDSSFQHIYKLFRELDTVIEKKDYYKKLIFISKDGYWQSDGVAIFQRVLQDKIKENLKLTCSLLSPMSDSEIISFWYFYFDGPSPVEKVPEDLEEVKQINKRIYNLLNEGLKKVQNHWL
ncbi:MAG TPA: hypothetical protein VJ958_05580 [Atribacterota bacterium]|nr:hypothetical protein [Atribacterota bacterium]